jgi:hypothetical protein
MSHSTRYSHHLALSVDPVGIGTSVVHLENFASSSVLQSPGAGVVATTEFSNLKLQTVRQRRRHLCRVQVPHCLVRSGVRALRAGCVYAVPYKVRAGHIIVV